MRRNAIDALAAHPGRAAALYGLVVAVAQVIAPLLTGGTTSTTRAAATGISVCLVFWGVGSLLRRQSDAAAEWDPTRSGSGAEERKAIDGR